MIRALIPLVFLAAPAQATWQLDQLTYHNWCPPAAIRSNLCKAGEDFVADDWIADRKLPTFSSPYVANQLIFATGEAAMASVIRVPYYTRRYQYTLFADTPICELTEIDQCQITYVGQAWEPASIPSNGQLRDVTMVFHNSDCKP